MPIALLRMKTTTVVRTCSVPSATVASPCGLIISAMPQAITAANRSRPPMNIRAAADPAVAHICPRWRRRAIPFGDIGLMLGQRLGEDMAAGAVGDEIERLGRRRMQHRLDARLAGIGDRPVGQARPAIGIVAVVGVKLGLEDAPAERLALGHRIDDGRIGIELHADPQAIAINAGDHRPFARLAGLFLDDRGQGDRLLRRRDRAIGAALRPQLRRAPCSSPLASARRPPRAFRRADSRSCREAAILPAIGGVGPVR